MNSIALAGKIGSVNTIVNKGGKLIGHNTDWFGALKGLGGEGGFEWEEGDPPWSRWSGPGDCLRAEREGM